MEKITKIEFTKPNKTIEKGFNLKLGGKITVITGENNAGKTNFISSLSKNEDISFNGGELSNDKVKIFYLPSGNIFGDEDVKVGDKAIVFKSLRDFLPKKALFTISKKEKDLISSLGDKVNKRLEKMCGGKSSVRIALPEEDVEVAIGSLLDLFVKFVAVDHKLGTERKKFSELGQGIQRLVIITFLLEVAKDYKDHPVGLILIEEPEAYLHPRLKKELNELIQELSDKYQVILTTHDPYFAYSNIDDGSGTNVDNRVYSFYRTDKDHITHKKEGVMFGIEDEMLHIFLFNKLMKEWNLTELEDFNKELLKKPGVRTVSYVRNPGEKPKPTALPMLIRHIIGHRVGNSNTYSDADLVESVRAMCNLLK